MTWLRTSEQGKVGHHAHMSPSLSQLRLRPVYMCSSVPRSKSMVAMVVRLLEAAPTQTV